MSKNGNDHHKDLQGISFGKAELNRLLDLGRILKKVVGDDELVFMIDQREQRKLYELAMEFFDYLDGRVWQV